MEHPYGQMPKTHDFYSKWPKIAGIWHPGGSICLKVYKLCGFTLILQDILHHYFHFQYSKRSIWMIIMVDFGHPSPMLSSKEELPTHNCSIPFQLISFSSLLVLYTKCNPYWNDLTGFEYILANIPCLKKTS